jgi:hypothetical protein
MRILLSPTKSVLYLDCSRCIFVDCCWMEPSNKSQSIKGVQLCHWVAHSGLNNRHPTPEWFLPLTGHIIFLFMCLDRSFHSTITSPTKRPLSRKIILNRPSGAALVSFYKPITFQVWCQRNLHFLQDKHGLLLDIILVPV